MQVIRTTTGAFRKLIIHKLEFSRNSIRNGGFLILSARPLLAYGTKQSEFLTKLIKGRIESLSPESKKFVATVRITGLVDSLKTEPLRRPRTFAMRN